ncbi:MAG TPA: PHP domain-containing protein, partial [Anaerolineales bacterium]|nr:PHP domain-containing protein [Anaerolineales bacterium]
MPEFYRVETHCHTIFSKDSLTHPADLLAACRKKGLDRVIITDHNTISGAVAANELDPDRVIIGEEIMTRAGELLAAFVLEEVPAGLT